MISRNVVRTLLLTLALTLSILALRPATGAECSNGNNRWVILGGECCCCSGGGWTQKWKGQSCIFGVWTDNGAIRCAGACAV